MWLASRGDAGYPVMTEGFEMEDRDTSIFELHGFDTAPLPGPRRTHLEWDGERFVEIDPTTGRVIDVGVAPQIEKEKS